MKTLIIIDVQNDFLPGGSLEVPQGDEIIPVINRVQEQFDLIVATQDWHPSTHMSFASNQQGRKPFDVIQWKGMDQVLWPDHCVQGTPGAEFHPTLAMDRVEAVFRKGMDPEIDSYSGFYDNGRTRNTGLAGYLRERGAGDLTFCGLAADVCVWFSMLDAHKAGFRVSLIEDATRPIDPEAFRKIKQQMKEMGMTLV